MNPCPTCDERLIEYVFGEMTPAERDLYATHLAGSPACAAEAAGLQAAEAGSRRTSAEEPSPALLAGLKAEARKLAAEVRASSSASERARLRARRAIEDGHQGGFLARLADSLSRSIRIPLWAPALAIAAVIGIVVATRGPAPVPAPQIAEVTQDTRGFKDQRREQPISPPAPAAPAAANEALGAAVPAEAPAALDAPAAVVAEGKARSIRETDLLAKKEDAADRRQAFATPAASARLSATPAPVAQPSRDRGDRREAEERSAVETAAAADTEANALEPAAGVAGGVAGGDAGGSVPFPRAQAAPGNTQAVIAALDAGDETQVAAAYNAWRRSRPAGFGARSASVPARPTAPSAAAAKTMADTGALGTSGAGNDLETLLAAATRSAALPDTRAKAAALALLVKLGEETPAPEAARALEAAIPIADGLGRDAEAGVLRAKLKATAQGDGSRR